MCMQHSCFWGRAKATLQTAERYTWQPSCIHIVKSSYNCACTTDDFNISETTWQLDLMLKNKYIFFNNQSWLRYNQNMIIIINANQKLFLKKNKVCNQHHYYKNSEITDISNLITNSIFLMRKPCQFSAWCFIWCEHRVTLHYCYNAYQCNVYLLVQV